MTFNKQSVIEQGMTAFVPRVVSPETKVMTRERLVAALPGIVDAVLAEIEQLHQPVPNSVSALHPIPLCSCLISECPCLTAQACTAIREAVQA